MAVLTVRKLNFGTYAAGASPTWTGLVMTTLDTPAATGGDTFANDGRTFVVAKNASGAPRNVTFTKQIKNADGIQENVMMPVADGVTRYIGPFDQSFNDSSGRVNMAWDTVASCTYAAVSLADDAA
jgi:hypothetical protein